MQTKTWVRVGLATVIATAVCGGVTLVGCTGDDNSGTQTKKDAATADQTNPTEGGNNPETGGNETGPKPESGTEGGTTPNAKVYLVHAASDPNAPPLRFCFGINTAGDGGGTITVADSIPPSPDTQVSPLVPIAGLPSGFGGLMNGSAKLAAFNLGSLNITLFAINALAIANDTADGGPDGGAEVPCEGLVGTDGKGKGGAGGGTLTLGQDYFNLGTVASCTNSPSSCLAPGQTWLVAVTGCLPGETGAAANFCGPGYSAATGNLGLATWKLDNTTAADAGLGAQMANASIAWDTTAAGSGAAGTAAGFWEVVTPEAGTSEAGAADGGDAGSPPPTPVFVFTPIAGPPSTGFGHISTMAVVPEALAAYSATTAGFTAALITADGGLIEAPAGCNPLLANCFSPLLFPLPVIDQLSGNPTNGSTYAQGNRVAFILVGDPTQLPYIGADGGPSATPTNPPIPNGKSAHFLSFPTHNP